MLGKYVCFYWQDWGFAVGKLVAPTAADANFGVVYPQWGTEAQTLTLEAYGLAGGAGSSEAVGQHPVPGCKRCIWPGLGREPDDDASGDWRCERVVGR